MKEKIFFLHKAVFETFSDASNGCKGSDGHDTHERSYRPKGKERTYEPTENPDNMHPMQARHAREPALTNEKMAKMLRKL